MKIVCLSPCCNLFFHVLLFFLSSRAPVVVALYPLLTVSIQYFWCAAVNPSCNHFENSSLLLSQSHQRLQEMQEPSSMLQSYRAGWKPSATEASQHAWWPPGFSLGQFIVRPCSVMISSWLSPIISWDLPMCLVQGKSTSGPDLRNLSPRVQKDAMWLCSSQFRVEIHPQAQKSSVWEHSWRLEWKEAFWFVFYK